MDVFLFALCFKPCELRVDKRIRAHGPWEGSLDLHLAFAAGFYQIKHDDQYTHFYF